MSRVPYTSVVGNIIYAMVCIKPDIVHTVSVVSRHENLRKSSLASNEMDFALLERHY